MNLDNKSLEVNNENYILSNNEDVLSSEIINKYLSENNNEFNINVYKTIDSTNTAIKELAVNGEREGTIIISEEQTGGRGRLGRKFHSPKGTGIYMSILLRPQISTSISFLITIAAAVAVAEAIEAVSDKEAKIKWVNDIYCDNKKVCGILTEASFNFQSNTIDYAVLGIGINVIAPKEGFAKEIKDIATGIFEDYSHTSINIRSKLIAKVLDLFWDYYKHIEDRSFLKSYKMRSLLINKEVTIFSNKSCEKATVLEIDDECRLKVKMEDGTIRLLSSGEVSIKL
ncbi:biotin--[acetyl-CoA-carboxylase] ligase [Clostridium sartagoforme]|uniref:biotin--[acetyl-CoA-carboxylase] ligase n=1 Tax=Clostridium sartagoforme TaxID=84031 RepID=UPI0031D62745